MNTEQATSAEPVLYERVGEHLAVATLNRPAKRNAMNPEMATALEEIVRRTEADDTIRAVILTAGEERVFCAGADLAAVAAGRAAGIETAAGGFGGFVYALRYKPWIAAVEGMALAGGCELVLACDMIVASDQASFGVPEVKRGLIAAAGGVHRLGTVLPRNVAHEMIVTGEPLSAVAAHRFGMVNRLTAPGGTMAAALTLGETIAANAPLAVQHSLLAARGSAALPDGAGRRIVLERLAALRRTEDFKEGPRAFVEKRAPVWTGR